MALFPCGHGGAAMSKRSVCPMNAIVWTGSTASGLGGLCSDEALVTDALGFVAAYFLATI